MKKRALEMALQKIKGHPEPKPELEQYMTPAPIAADILYMTYARDDIGLKRVIDLGCGTGIFAIGSALLGAERVCGIDIDEKAIELAHENAKTLEVDVRFEVMEIGDVLEKGDTVIQNPPFGAQKKHADQPFIEKALECAPVVYSLHLSETRGFVRKLCAELGVGVQEVKNYKFEVRHMFPFHTREKRHFDVSLFRFERKRT